MDAAKCFYAHFVAELKAEGYAADSILKHVLKPFPLEQLALWARTATPASTSSRPTLAAS